MTKYNSNKITGFLTNILLVAAVCGFTFSAQPALAKGNSPAIVAAGQARNSRDNNSREARNNTQPQRNSQAQPQRNTQPQRNSQAQPQRNTQPQRNSQAQPQPSNQPPRNSQNDRLAQLNNSRQAQRDSELHPNQPQNQSKGNKNFNSAQRPPFDNQAYSLRQPLWYPSGYEKAPAPPTEFLGVRDGWQVREVADGYYEYFDKGGTYRGSCRYSDSLGKYLIIDTLGRLITNLIGLY